MSDGAAPDLLGQVNDYLLQVYRAGRSSASPGQQLAFEPIGVPLSADMFKVNPTDAALSPAMAIEVLANLSDIAPHVDGGTFLRGLRTLGGCYELMLYGSTPGAAGDPGFAHIKSTAEEAFGDPLGSLQPEGAPYRPVETTPSNWYDPMQGQNWTARTFAQSDTTTTGPPPPGPTPPPHPPLAWRVVPPDLSPVVAQRSALYSAHDELMHMPAGRPGMIRPVAETARPLGVAAPVGSRPPAIAAFAATHAAAPVEIRPGAAPVGPSPIPPARIIRPIAVAQSVAALESVSTPQHVATQNLSVTFEYCLVLVSRPWISDAFLQLRNWYVPGYRIGELSSGSDTAGTGNFALVPTAFIAIRKLAVQANWSDTDRTALGSSASLGPFSLFGRSFDATTNTLSCPGMQLVAWVCESQPPLPPVSDPALPPSAP